VLRDLGVLRNGRAFAISLFLIFLLSTPLLAAEPGSPDRLTLKEAVETALRQHPTLLAARGFSRAQEARVGEVKAGLYPHLNFTADYRRATANFTPSSQSGSSLNRFFTGTENSNSSFDNYTAALSLQQLIYDFGKTGADIEAAKNTLQGTRWDEETSRRAVVLNVKVAYFGLLQARRLVLVNEETVRQFEEHLRQSGGFFKAGTRPKFDVTKAEVDLTNAQLNLIKARNAAEVARVALVNAMGVPDRPIGEIEDLLSFEKFKITQEEVLEEALRERTDLLSLSAKRQSAAAQVRSVRRSYFPVLSGSADYTYRGQDFPLVWNWDIGLNLTFPLFSGFQTKSQVAEARANLEASQANEEVLRQAIFLEVRQDYLNLSEAEERVRTSDIVVRQAEENLALANGRFQAGVGTSVERTDAQVTLANAKTTQVQALYDYRVSEANLEKAMGRE
jgi:outer membrane protein